MSVSVVGLLMVLGIWFRGMDHLASNKMQFGSLIKARKEM